MSNDGMIRNGYQQKGREVRGYTLLRNVRDKGAASAHRQGLSRPCTHEQGTSLHAIPGFADGDLPA
jgi:hypothetical protein